MMERDSTPWIIRPRPNPRARGRLICFPHAGGAAADFRAWPDRLPSEIDVCLVQLPGRANRWREAPFTRFPPLVQALGPVVRPYLDLPCGFFGHSMGALIGFEIARYLAGRAGPGPIHLFVAGCRAPQLPRENAWLHEAPDAALVQELRRLNGTPEGILRVPELLDFLLPTLRADFALVETYAYAEAAPLGCPISAFGGEEDPDVSRDDLAAWSEQTTARFDLRVLPGDHFFVRGAHVALYAALLADLRQHLDA